MIPATRTTCPYCGVGCGVLAAYTDHGPHEARTEIRGDPDHPANRGALCSKGAALGETLGFEGRLLLPRLHGSEVPWSVALDEVAQKFRTAIDAHGPESVAFYVSGQMLTEDYYVANKLMKGFLGSANIDTNSRLCMSSAVAAHKRAFGEDLVPITYEDLELSDLIVLVGSNAAWCHPVLYQRIIKAKAERPQMRLVVIDPRRTPTCDVADLHLPIRSGTDVTLFNGLLAFLARRGSIDHDFVEQHTSGVRQTLLVADNTAGDPDAVARACGLTAETLRQFYEWFAGTERVITMFSQGVNQSSSGTDKANSIINAHLYTGRIGRRGMGPFSITGQPNAMGGREVGGLANTLAAHMDLENHAHRRIVQDFWRSPTIADRPGLKAVDLFEAVHRGQIKALWIMATNPLVSLPNANRAREALRRCEFVAVSDCIAETDTTRLAHVLLPAAAWGEKSGTVTNSDRHIARQRAFMRPPGEARPDWWIIGQVAQRLGFAREFAFTSAAQIFDEHARLSATDNPGTRAFNIGGLAGLSEPQYDGLAPTQWPVLPGLNAATGPRGTQRLFGEGRFYHPDGRARLVPTRPRTPLHALDREYPLLLNTGRIRDQWHTMTRSGRSARLSAHLPEPFVDMHPADALSFGLGTGGLVRVETRWGHLVARLRASGEMQRGSVFVPIHWNGISASDACVGTLVSPAVDPVSGEPEFKSTPARVEPFVVSWYGFALTRKALPMDQLSWWVRTTGEQCLRYEIAGRRVPGDWTAWVRALVGPGAGQDWLEYSDAAAGTYRAVQLQDERLQTCIFISRRPELLSRAWLASLFRQESISPAERRNILAGVPADPAADSGTVVCACFGVGSYAIQNAIAAGCADARALGKKLKAGTNCGSCVPELNRMLAASTADA